MSGKHISENIEERTEYCNVMEGERIFVNLYLYIIYHKALKTFPRHKKVPLAPNHPINRKKNYLQNNCNI